MLNFRCSCSNVNRCSLQCNIGLLFVQCCAGRLQPVYFIRIATELSTVENTVSFMKVETKKIGSWIVVCASMAPLLVNHVKVQAWFIKYYDPPPKKTHTHTHTHHMIKDVTVDNRTCGCLSQNHWNWDFWLILKRRWRWEGTQLRNMAAWELSLLSACMLGSYSTRFPSKRNLTVQWAN